MTDTKDNQGERLERLLQRWGADEAVRRAQPPETPPAPAIAERRAGGRSALRVVLRWAPLAAAAMVLAAAVAVVYLPGGRAKRSSMRAEPSRRPPRADQGPQVPRAPGGEAEVVASLRKQVQDLRSRLSAAEDKAAEIPSLAGQIARLQSVIDQRDRAHAEEVGGWEKALAKQQKTRQVQADALAAAKQRIVELEVAERLGRASAAEAARAKSQVEDLRRRLAAAAEELARRRKAVEVAEAELLAARQETQKLKVRHREIVDSFRRTYLASVAPGQSGLTARKTAVRARQMIDRLANLSDDVRGEPTRRLLDRLEAVLTRLELMDTTRPGSLDSFQRLLDQGGLAGEIDAALSAPGQTEDVQNWLFEAKLILTGAPDAG